jgi:hypothetical protein
MFLRSSNQRRPADAHPRAFPLLNPALHVIILDELSPVCLRDALTHGGAELRVFFDQTQGGILDKPPASVPA